MIGSNLFANIQFVLDLGSAPYKVKVQFQKLITTNGGIISYILTRKSKYLVVLKESNSSSYDTYKYRKAKKIGIPIVTCDFLHECIRQKAIVDTDNYLVGSESTSQAFCKGKISSSGNASLSKVKTLKKFNLNGASRYKIDSGDCPEFPSEFHVCKFAVLSKLMTVNKLEANQLSCVEIHAATDHDNGNPVWLYRVMLSKTSGKKSDSVICVVYPVSDAIEALQCFDSLAKNEVDHGLVRVHEIPANFNIGSFRLKMLLSEMKSSSGNIDAEIVRLVETIWSDSVENLNDILNISLARITPDHLRNALIVLVKIEEKISQKDANELQKLSREFYDILPHNEKHTDSIDTVAKLAKKRELCQLLKDMLLVSEITLLDDQPNSSLSKYSSLNCSIVKLEEEDSDMKQIKDMLYNESDAKSNGICIHNIFRVNRSAENVAFKSDLEPSQLLYHASAPHNFVGILSRGLLMPLSVTEELGVERTDEGKLGNGIYFTDSLLTASSYAMVSKSRGSRLLLINDVALGKIFETKEKMVGISSPPNGFQSVKGIPSSNEEPSMFANNEYVIYNINQQRMKYIVEFTLDVDERKENSFTNQPIQPRKLFSQDSKISTELAITRKQPKEPKAGLLFESDVVGNATAKLEEVHIRAKIIDLAAEVIVFQRYKNNSNGQLEAKYVFPLSENAAVCGFEAFINDKHVVGVVKEKEKAHREYKQAISKGHGAYLMDEEKSNIFTVSVGNIPPYACVIIKIVYVSELVTSGAPESKVRFYLPGSIAPWDKRWIHILNDVTQSKTKSKWVSHHKKFSLVISIDMPFKIVTVESPSHKIHTKRTETKACVKLDSFSFITDKNFLLEIGMAEIHVPRIWIEKESEDSSEQVAMVTFYPEFDFERVTDFESLILLDMSNSMNGPAADNALAVTTMLIESLPGSCRFNIAAFGSCFAELFFTFEKATDDFKSKAKRWVASCTANFGGSDALHLLSSLMKLYDQQMGMFNVFLISDGHLSESDNLMHLAHRANAVSRSSIRIFSFGVGDSPNWHLLQTLSVATGGWFEHMNPDRKSMWNEQVLTQMEKAGQPVLTNIHIDWCNYSESDDPAIGSAKPVQVPEQVKCLFSGSQLVAYSFLPRCTKATLNASVNGEDFSTVVTATDLCVTHGKTLHRLAAKAIFKEYETGILETDPLLHFRKKDERKSYIVSLSVQYSVVTKYTSFIAIEERDKDDHAIICSPSISDLIENSFDDILPEIVWPDNEVLTDDKITNLLHRANQIESASIVEARQVIQEAKELFLSLHSPSSYKAVYTLIAGAECRLDMETGKNELQSLSQIFLGDKNEIDFEFIKEIMKNDESDLQCAVKDLVHKAWPEGCIIKLINFNEEIQPFIVGAFSHVQSKHPSFTKSQATLEIFWKEVETLKLNSDEGSFKDCAVILNDAVLQIVTKIKAVVKKQFLATFQCKSGEKSIFGGSHELIDKDSRVNMPPMLNRMGDKSTLSLSSSISSHRLSNSDANLLACDSFYDCYESIEYGAVPPLPPRDYSVQSIRKAPVHYAPPVPPGIALSRPPTNANLIGKLRPDVSAMEVPMSGRQSALTVGHRAANSKETVAPFSKIRRGRMEKKKSIKSRPEPDRMMLINESSPVRMEHSGYKKSCFPGRGGGIAFPCNTDPDVGAMAVSMKATSAKEGIPKVSRGGFSSMKKSSSPEMASEAMLFGYTNVPFSAKSMADSGYIEKSMNKREILEQENQPTILGGSSYNRQARISLQSACDVRMSGIESYSFMDELEECSMNLVEEPLSLESRDRFSIYSDAAGLNSSDDSDASISSDLDECDFGLELSEHKCVEQVCVMSLQLDSIGRILSDIVDKVNDGRVWCLHNIEVGNCSKLVSSLYQNCSKVIINAGGSSLGSHVFTNAVNMLFTSVCIEIINVQCQKYVSDVAKYAMTLKAAMEWLSERDKIDPFLYSRLELGRSWSHAARCFLEELAKNEKI